MSHLSRRTFLELAGAAALTGCSGGKNSLMSGSIPLLAFSDVHFDPFYTKNADVFQSLNQATFDQWQSIFESYESSSPTPPSAWGTDTNYPLLKLALASVQQNLGSSEVVIYTGDLLGHNIPGYYQAASGSSDQASMVAFTNNAAAFVMQRIRNAVGTIPVVFAVGNCDSYTGYGPDSTFLANTAEMYSSQMLHGIASYEDFASTFTTAGYYSAELFQGELLVIGLNTIMCSPLVPGDNSAAVTAQFAWLDAQLAAAQTAGQKVWILMHVPAGGFLAATAAGVDSSGHIASAVMMWEPDYQTAFLNALIKYPGVVSMMIAGHTHMDEYRMVLPGYVLEVAPGISPCFANDPAYKLFSLDVSTFAPSDYEAVKYSLAMLPEQFESYYTFTQRYGAADCSPASMEKLYPELVSSPALQAIFRQYYFCGAQPGNTITNLTWPVYWAGVGNATAEGIVAAVNSY
ncbi:MAG: metallophosphoesterase [Acidobacteriaceae bacterium]